MKNALFLLFACVLYYPSTPLCQQLSILDTGGPLMPEQATYDVTHYDLSLDIKPDDQYIEGKVIVSARFVHPTDVFVLDLDTLLIVKHIAQKLHTNEVKPLKFSRQVGKIWIALESTQQPGSQIKLVVEYSGHPRIAPRAPWDGGFSWAKTPSGDHWIATTCQGDGADLWWPMKDHVSDKPDSMDMHFRVPPPLVVASNGHLRLTETHPDGDRTYHWHVSTPISGYNIALNIAPYKTITEDFKSIGGDKFPVIFYVLPEDYDKGKILFEEIKRHLRFFEKFFGPYPFRIDKYGVAQTPHLGMEHQTIIAYGANFSNSSMTGVDWGFDALHHHELAHEWWGNLITNSDWKDMWLHEGFGSYMQGLYIEELKGKEAYLEFMRYSRFFSNTLPIAPRTVKTGKEIYRAPIYTKGAWVLHALRGLIGDENFFRVLRKMAYPTADLEKEVDGSQVRFVSTEDFLRICEAETQLELDWFFEVYLHQAKLPKLYSRVEGQQIKLRWEAPIDVDFKMPIEIQLGKTLKRVNVDNQGVTIDFKAGIKPVVDPNGWLLCELMK